MAKTYDPANQRHRHDLAVALEKRLLDAGFIEESPEDHVNERVFYFPVNDGIRIQVWTTIMGRREMTCVRSEGKDSIKVNAVYRTKAGHDQGIVRAHSAEEKPRSVTGRINRTGNIEDIVERTIVRAREVWKAARTPHRCPKCEAPTFISKSKNTVCADLCWKPIEDRAPARTRPYQPYRRWSRW